MSLKPSRSYLAPLLLGVWPLAGCFYNPTGSTTDTATTTGEELTPQERACIECPDTAKLCFCLDPEADTEDDPWVPPEFACTPASVAVHEEMCRKVWELDKEDELTPDQFFCPSLMCGEDTEDVPTTGEPLECASWSPASMVTTSGGVHFMDDADVGDLIADPSPLLLCDDVILAELATGGGFEVDQADLGELLYVLGLRDGDIPLTLNGFSLETVEDAMFAFNELWFVEGETDFELDVQRPFAVVTLYYSLY
ncbi:hypothetical protein [Nannocystis sp. SCPEA4]|uniref:hypothetical protein n=1 Tax=Nannocystis sp. SCPEA4 TaxID=2996787 RepID=UPI00226FAFD3|nr:hypothetical protein [Nannocystis sp. SCPEA4]MCY1053895.1 hypothetical protein [Nannocystis sp. SCPEA4]